MHHLNREKGILMSYHNVMPYRTVHLNALPSPVEKPLMRKMSTRCGLVESCDCPDYTIMPSKIINQDFIPVTGKGR